MPWAMNRPPCGKRDMVRLRVAADAAGRPGISVENCDGREDQRAGDTGEKNVSRQWPKREVKLRAPDAAQRQHQHDGSACDDADRPAPGRADRALGSPAHQPECGVKRRDRLSVCHPPRRAAPHQQAAEGNDEGRNAEIGDDKALQGAKDDAEEKPGRQRYYPGCRMFEAEKLRKEHGLNDAHDHANEAEHRTNR